MPQRKSTPASADDATRPTTNGRRASAGGRKTTVATGKKAPTPQPKAQPLDEQTLAKLRRVVIEGVRPEINEGRFPAKGTLGEVAVIEADVYAEGHDELAVDLGYRRAEDRTWKRVHMMPLGNDRWRASFPVAQLTTYYFALEGWVDHFATWQRDLARKVDAHQDVSAELLTGAKLIEEALPRVPAKDAESLRNAAALLSGRTAVTRRVEVALDKRLGALMREAVDKDLATRYQRELRIQADSPKAQFSTWYEMFPRSASPDPKRHGTFRDVEKRLPYVAEMGFDVLYLPPVHPIGKTKRKGPNNRATPGRYDPGSPWAIGSADGGHKAIAPELGTLDDFRRLVRKAKDRNIYIALDIALQCSPDHPYVKQHPEWFKVRPDGSLQYAENPPKKYEDIYPFNFETPAWESLWNEVKSIFLHWMEQGVTIFRVDNPHTKPFRFWEWLIAEVHAIDPGVIFLAEAFTRPRVMYHLAKLGFTQSYTYFTWRNTRQELIDYLTELTSSPVADFFRPSFWPNTPDILHEYLQHGGRPAFVTRLVLAATLSSNYGLYGPAFELMEHTPREPASEEYLDSEKYQQRTWDITRADSLRDVITLVNRARRENPALQSNNGLRFHDIDNAQLIAYSKRSSDGSNIVICVANLDTNFTQSGWVDLPISDWGIAPDEPFQVHDLIANARYTWQGSHNFVQLNPHQLPAHIFRLRKRTGGTGWEFE